MTQAGTTNELNVQNEREENTHTHTHNIGILGRQIRLRYARISYDLYEVIRVLSRYIEMDTERVVMNYIFPVEGLNDVP